MTHAPDEYNGGVIDPVTGDLIVRGNDGTGNSGDLIRLALTGFDVTTTVVHASLGANAAISQDPAGNTFFVTRQELYKYDPLADLLAFWTPTPTACGWLPPAADSLASLGLT